MPARPNHQPLNQPHSQQPHWRLAIDVGGTFTDCIGISPQGEMRVGKTLSSGRTKGLIRRRLGSHTIFDPLRQDDPDGFWNGAQLHIAGLPQVFTVRHHESPSGQLTLSEPLPADVQPGWAYELETGNEAPIVGIRHLLGLSAGEPLPPCEVRLGTTRGTNALLERRGARVAFVVTAGFGDLLQIGDQARPNLFELSIRKPAPLAECAIEIEERLTAAGEVQLAPDPDRVREQLTALKQRGIDSLAVALLHSYRNPVHEQLIGDIALSLGFGEVVLSHTVSPTIKILPRAESAVLDACLNPILRDYLQLIESSLPQALGGVPPSLQLMTSSGSLVPADRFTGKESVLSGPAGGAIGYSITAEAVGFPKSIGFDMGGTSTDVSRYDGRFDMEFESRKAGVRITSPTLAIETVAAGGGSICSFDGIRLTVGPASAGADPGPACYGRGGPLTITDCNLILGRIVASRFPFPPDVEAAHQRLKELCERLRCKGGRELSVEQLAEGFIEIANSHMARAVRRISVAKGYDPQEYALAVFGGAAAQHACGLARELGMRTILVHPLASVLSAFGIACAGESAHVSTTLLTPIAALHAGQWETIFSELERQLPVDAAANGDLERAIELRYAGLESTILVTEPMDSRWSSSQFASQYESLHELQFGFRFAGRAIEVVTVRLTRRRAAAIPISLRQGAVLRQMAGTKQRVRVAGEWVELTPWTRTEESGDGSTAIDGPALICEPLTTLFVEPGYRVELLHDGTLYLRHAEPQSLPSRWSQTGHSDHPDPIRLEVFHHLFASIAEQMGETLRRTSVSTNVKERLDYSCALFDREGELIVNAPHIPVHLGAMSETVKCVLADNPDLSQGDVVLTNDPYRGGSHLPDLTVVTPVFEADDQLAFVVASRAHHAELGGIVPGSMPPFSRTLADEGVLIRSLRVVQAGVFQEQHLREILEAGPYPSRRPNDNVADVSAQIAANRTGVRMLERMVAEHSLLQVQNNMRFIRESSAEKVRRALARIPDGEYRHTDYLDDGSPITVAITIQGDTASVDFTGTGPVLASNLNANRAIVTSAVLYVFRLLIDEDVPLNGGVLLPVTIILPECLLNPPAHADPRECAAIVGGNVETSQRVVDVLLGALKLAAASQGTMNNLTFGDATFGYYETICGGSGATSVSPGADAVQVHMTNTRLTDVELMEHRYPVRIRRFSIRSNSGGAGQHRGGNGIIREIEFLQPMTVSILSQRRGPFAPPGSHGGGAGQLGRNTLIQRDGSEISLGAAAQCPVTAGDRIRIETPGGGGWG